jgi:hypothetical protein
LIAFRVCFFMSFLRLVVLGSAFAHSVARGSRQELAENLAYANTLPERWLNPSASVVHLMALRVWPKPSALVVHLIAFRVCLFISVPLLFPRTVSQGRLAENSPEVSDFLAR